MKFCEPCCLDPLTCLRSNSCLRPTLESTSSKRVCNLASDWDSRGLSLARLVASWSKDPSTKVGAAIFRPDKTVASIGFNGFPRGVADDSRLHDRPTKYEIIVHAEINAILNCRERPVGYTLYTTFFPCSRCAASIIQSGISRVCSPVPNDLRWEASNALATTLLTEAGVSICLITPEGLEPNTSQDISDTPTKNFQT